VQFGVANSFWARRYSFTTALVNIKSCVNLELVSNLRKSHIKAQSNDSEIYGFQFAELTLN